MDANGRNLEQLTNDEWYDAFPAWSADGRSIVFSSDRDGNFELYTMRADGTERARITNDPAADTAPVWIP
jgi:TolB protein